MLGFSRVKGILAGLGASLIALTLFFLRWPLSGIELALYDRNFQWFWAEPSAPSEIVIVAIDSASLDTLGEFPWPRAHHAAVIREVARDGAKAMGVDIGFFGPDRYDPVNDQRLIQATAEAGNVVYPMAFEEYEDAGRKRVRPLLPLAELRAVSAGYGHSHLEEGPDGIVRSVHLAYRTEDAIFWRIDVEVLRRYLDVPESGIRPLRPGVVGIGSLEVPVGPRRRQESEDETTTPDHEMQIGFIGGAGTFERISARDVIEGRFPRDSFKDKIVLYGATASGLGDSHLTPMSGDGSGSSGVEIQASILNSLLQRRFLRRAGPGFTVLLSVLGSIAVGSVYSRFRARAAFWLMLSLLLAVTVVYFLAFNAIGYWVQIAPIPVALMISFAGSSLIHDGPITANRARIDADSPSR